MIYQKISLLSKYLLLKDIFSEKIKNKEVFIATNLLESMITKPYPTRAEANDIYNSIEMGASGLVLAAETAVGNFPEKCVAFLKHDSTI